jgi:hypothetical protein
MDLAPCFDEPLLLSGKRAADEFERVDGENGRRVLVVRVKVRPVMRAAGLDEHPDYDPEEPGEFWHTVPHHLVQAALRRPLRMSRERRPSGARESAQCGGWHSL